MSRSNPVKIAIVGLGLIGPRHAQAVLDEPTAELACFVDPSPNAEVVAQKFNCALFKSVQEMLASASKPDAALVCTPNHTHVSISQELLEGGLHVLCEKPISIDVSSGKALIQCAKKHNRKLLIGHHRRFNRYVMAAKDALPSLGQIVAINGLWTIYKPPEYFESPTEWRRLDSGGPVLINLIHEIDILHHLLGPIIRVHAEATLSQRGFAAEEGAAITLKFAIGVVGTFLLSDAVISPHNFEGGTGENPTIPSTGQDFYRIFGSGGSLSVPDMTRWTYQPGKKSWNEELQHEKVKVLDTKIPFQLQIEHFVKVVLNEETPSCPGSEGLRALVVCEAIRESMRQQQPVNVTLDD